MGNCLVTKLKATVNNNSLRKLGEAWFKTYSSQSADSTTNCIVISLKNGYNSLSARIISGSGSLCDSDLVSNLESEKTYQKDANANIYVYFTNADSVIGISDCNAVRSVWIHGAVSNWEFNFDEFSLYEGEFRSLNLTGAHLTGNIKNFKILAEQSGLTFVIGTDALNRTLGNTMYGDITSLNGFYESRGITTIQGLGYQSGITGNLVSFVNANPSINTFQTFKGTSVTGDLSLVSTTSAASFFTGKDMPTGGKFRYSSTRSGGYLLSAENINFGTDLERYILDQADKDFSSIGNKIISVSGTIDLTKTEVTTAVAAIKAKNPMIFTINGQNMLV